MTPEENWDGPIQDAIQEHDRLLGHLPKAQAVGPVTFFHPPSWPNGGGTVYLRPAGNPYASLDEVPERCEVVERPEGDSDAEGR